MRCRHYKFIQGNVMKFKPASLNYVFYDKLNLFCRLNIEGVLSKTGLRPTTVLENLKKKLYLLTFQMQLNLLLMLGKTSVNQRFKIAGKELGYFRMLLNL